MSKLLARDALAATADIVAAPCTAADKPAPREEIDRSFELPAGLYMATAALYLGFVGVMALTFGGGHLVLPLAIIVLSIVAGFGVPALWVRMNPAKSRRALSFGALQRRGIMTASGRLNAGAAAVQVLILPVLILGWGIAIAVIAALV